MEHPKYGKVALQKPAGLVTKLLFRTYYFRLEDGVRYKYPLLPDEEPYAVVDPESHKLVEVVVPSEGPPRLKKPFRIYYLFPFVENVQRRDQLATRG